MGCASRSAAGEPRLSSQSPFAQERSNLRNEKHRVIRRDATVSNSQRPFGLTASHLRHQMRNPDASAVFDRALTLLLADLEKRKLAGTERPRMSRPVRTQSRHIPASVRRAVWARDGGRCRFEGTAGRCTETGLIEFHPVVPYAAGGPTTVENLELRCAAHNRYEAAQSLGLFVREARDRYKGETVLFQL